MSRSAAIAGTPRADCGQDAPGVVRAASGCPDCRQASSRAGSLLPALLTFGSLGPSMLLVRKPG